MDKYKEFKRQFVLSLGALQAAVAEAEGSQRLHLRMVANAIEGIYKALLEFDGDAVPASALLPPKDPPKPPKPKADKPKQRKYGEYGWVKLTAEEYVNLIEKLGEQELKRCIDYIDESAQTTNNKNGWHDWNLTIQKCSRNKWGIKPWGAPPPKEPTSADKAAAAFEKDMLRQFMEGGA